MTTRADEVTKLVALAAKCAEHVDEPASNPKPLGSDLLLLAYHGALTAEWLEYEKRLDCFDPRRVEYAKRICAQAGQDPNCLATNIPQIVAQVMGAVYGCPVFNYRPKPLWALVYNGLPEFPEESHNAHP